MFYFISKTSWFGDTMVHTETTIGEEPVFFTDDIFVPVVSKGDATSSSHRARDCGTRGGI